MSHSSFAPRAPVCTVDDRECLPGVGTDRLSPRNSLSDIGFGPFLWHAQLMMELNMDTVLAAVNDLHASTGNRVFTLIEIAEAIDGQQVTPPPGNENDHR